MTGDQRYFGMYRGTVINNIDPMQIGRIQAMVPDVSKFVPTSWCMPCVPLAGKLEGTYMLPQIGAGVWIQFEQGDPDFPVWMGGFWGAFRRGACSGTGAPADPAGADDRLPDDLAAPDDAQRRPPLPMEVPVPPPAPPGTGGIVLRSPTGGDDRRE